ncbi:MAG: hypothetical protein ACI8RZ_008000 [Myxococcota bacterium]|jgi:hypothetical protein
MTDPIDIDILDIVVVVLGVLAGMVAVFVSGVEGHSDLIDYFLLACAVVPLLIKRTVFPTPTRPPHDSAVARLAYLLTGILGTLMVGAAGLMVWAALKDGSVLTTALSEAAPIGLLGGGLLAVAVVLDRLRPTTAA